MSGVAVIETGRILGGDSGFVYIGEIQPKMEAGWPIEVRVKRHDPRVESIFGDIDDYVLQGILEENEAPDGVNQYVMRFDLGGGAIPIVVGLTKAADLP